MEDQIGLTPLDYAILHDRKKAMDLLISEGHSFSRFTKALDRAAKANRLDIAEFLINQGVDVNVADMQGATPLFYARTLEMVQLLVNNGGRVDVRMQGNPILIKIIHGLKREDDDMSDMIEYSAYPYNESGAKYAIIKFLLEHGANVNASNYQKVSPLHMLPHLEIAKLLIEHGADLNARTTDNRIPLGRAIETGSAITQLLLGHPSIEVNDAFLQSISEKIDKNALGLLDFKINWRKYIAFNGWMRISEQNQTPLLMACVCNNTEALSEFFNAQLQLVPARYSELPQQERHHNFAMQETDRFKPKARYYINAVDKSGYSALMYLARYNKNSNFINNLLAYCIYNISSGDRLHTEEVLKAAAEAASCGNYRLATALVYACIHNNSEIIVGEELAPAEKLPVQITH